MTANKGVANGYAPLDGTGKVPMANLPASGSDVDTLASESDVTIASPANNQVLTYNSSTSKWVNQAAPVTSVAGKTGAVTLAEADIPNLTSDLAAKATLSGNNTWTGQQHFSGVPFYDAVAIGLVGDGTTDNIAAFNTWMNSLAGSKAYELYLPPGNYFFNTAAGSILSVNKCIKFIGALAPDMSTNNFINNGNFPTTLSFPAGAGGLKFSGNGAGGWSLQGIQLQGGGKSVNGAVSPSTSGVWITATGTMIGCYIANFPGMGVEWDGSTVCDFCYFSRVWVDTCFIDGFHAWGSDAQAGVFMNCSARGCKRWGFNDESIIGNAFIECHTVNNLPSSPRTITNLSTTAGSKTITDPGASFTQADVGSGIVTPSSSAIADPTSNLYPGAGNQGSNLNYIQSVTNATTAVLAYNANTTATTGANIGNSNQTSGPYRSSLSGQHSVFLGCYSESGQQQSRILGQSLVFGGDHGAGVYGHFLDGGNGTAGSGGLVTYTGIGLANAATTPANQVQQLGVLDPGNAAEPYPMLYIAQSKYDVFAFKLAFIDGGSAAASGWYLFLPGNPTLWSEVIPSVGTSTAYGNFGNLPVRVFREMAIKSKDNNATVVVLAGDSIPVGGRPDGQSFTVGDITWNRTPSTIGSVLGWKTTVAGSPGTQVPIFNPTSGVSSYSATGTLAVTDTLAKGTGGAGGITLTLPTLIAADNGQRLRVAKVDSGAGAVTVAGASGGNVGLNSQWNSHDFIWDGSSWLP